MVQERSETGSEPVSRASLLLARAVHEGITARALGGVAVAMRCPSALREPLKREYHDLDLVTTRGDAKRLSELLVDAGFHPHERFNRLHGRSRLIFAGSDGLHLDVLVGEFAMCHRLDLSDRLHVSDTTLSLADLLLTKLQIAELNAKDAQDLAALLLDHALTEDDEGINSPYVSALLSRDWGWWRTVTDNLDLLDAHLPGLRLDAQRTATVSGRLTQLRERVARTKKSLGWRSRARLGDRISWRDEPEEIAAS